MASDSILVRGVPEDVRAWIEEECGRQRVTQREFLLSLITHAAKPEEGPTLFDSMAANAAQAGNGNLPFSFIDLFAGIGGLRLGLEAVGGRCLFSSEWDEHCQRTYKAWFGEVPHGDLTKIEPTDIPNHDVLAAGFPCQPFSIAGVSKKNALGRPHGFEDVTQGNLFFILATIIQIKRPPVIMLENVKNLQSHDGGKTWAVIQSTLENLEYKIFSKVMNAAAWVPQHRERIFIIGFDRHVFGDSPPFEFPKEPAGPAPKFRDILEPAADPKYTLSDHLWKYLQDYAQRHKEKGNGFGFGLVNMDGISRTLSARYYKDGSEILIPQKGKNPRRLTPSEARRLMGFPDKPIVVSDTQAYRQFGNAVVPRVVEAVARQVVQVLDWHLTTNLKGCLLKAPKNGNGKGRTRKAAAGGVTRV
ncbi:MAG: DNA (cytosine-5-)-methyltransferase [Nitrospiraceae bacterium]|nr:DNA (cytosine-5-)-methyltransferase [Nitrospiraceae bacterium]